MGDYSSKYTETEVSLNQIIYVQHRGYRYYDFPFSRKLTLQCFVYC